MRFMKHDETKDRVATYDNLDKARAGFGEDYGAFVVELEPQHVEALRHGRVVALDVNGREYAVFLKAKR